MTEAVLVPRLTVGPLAAVGAFLLLTGGRLPRARPNLLGRAMVARWVGLAAQSGFEEVVWRGIVLGGLLRPIGPAGALVVSSLAFALWHRRTLGCRCVVHLVTGVAFGAAFLAGGLAAAIVAHAVYNLLVDWSVHAERARLRRR